MVASCCREPKPGATGDTAESAEALFAKLWPRVELAARGRSRRRMRRAELDDFVQYAGLALWGLILRWVARGAVPARIRVAFILSRAWKMYRSEQRRLPVFDENCPPAVARPEPSIMIDGVRMTRTELRLDCGKLLEMLRGPLLTFRQVAERAGVSRQAVAQSPARFGGVLLPSGRWVFPGGRSGEASAG